MQGYGVNIIVEGGELEKILARLSAGTGRDSAVLF